MTCRRIGGQNSLNSKTRVLDYIGDSEMSKPSSYFSVKEHTFEIKGRKGNENRTVTEPALFFEGELLQIEYKPMPTVPAKVKNIRNMHLEQIASILDEGYSEEPTVAVLKSRYKELCQILKDNKILALDFCQFVKDELDKMPKSKAPGEKKGREARNPKLNDIVGMMALIPNKTPEEMASYITELVNDSVRMESAVRYLKDCLKNNGRSANTLTSGKVNPLAGCIKLRRKEPQKRLK